MRERSRSTRRGAAAAELAILLPLLGYIFLIATDYARLFYALATVTDSARAGAMYYATQANPTAAGIRQAALADAANLSPAPTVTSASGTDGLGNATVQVTVTYDFRTVAAIPGLSSTTTLSRTVMMTPNPP